MDKILEIKNLKKDYGSFTLNIPNLELEKGEIIGFVGENGAGKTTTIKAIFSLINKDSGDILFNGENIESLSQEEREKMALCFDDSTLPENFNLAKIRHYGQMLFSSWDDELWEVLTAKLKLPVDKKIKEFSKGTKAKAQLAFALSHSPELLVLDEVTSALDPVIREEVLELLQEFIMNYNHSVLFSSHITNDLDKIADRIIFIHEGEILLEVGKLQLDEEYGIVRANGQIENECHIIASLDRAYSVDYLIDNKQEFIKINPDMIVDKATIEDILLFLVKEKN